MKMQVIACNQLSLELGGSRVLDGVTFCVDEGDFVGIVGPNGGGKTTLLRVMLGIQTFDSGKVSVFGKPPGQSPEKIGYVPQRLFFDRSFPISVRELVLMGRLPKKSVFERYNAVDRACADEAMHLAGLETLMERRIGNLSGGELQRVLVARALAGKPELLLLDEPTSSIDPEMKTTIYDLMAHLRARLKGNLTMVLVSHDTETISHYVTKMVNLNVTLNLLQGFENH